MLYQHSSSSCLPHLWTETVGPFFTCLTQIYCNFYTWVFSEKENTHAVDPMNDFKKQREDKKERLCCFENNLIPILWPWVSSLEFNMKTRRKQNLRFENEMGTLPPAQRIDRAPTSFRLLQKKNCKLEGLLTWGVIPSFNSHTYYFVHPWFENFSVTSKQNTHVFPSGVSAFKRNSYDAKYIPEAGTSVENQVNMRKYSTFYKQSYP